MGELMWKHGYSTTSPREVRELSGVGQGSMYHYFPTKRDLGLAALRHNCQKQSEVSDAALESSDDPLEALTAYISLPRQALRGCRVGRMAQDRAVMADDELRAVVAQAFDRLHEKLVVVIGAAAERTRAWVERIGPELAAHAVDWHMLQAVFDDDLDPERLAYMLVAVLQGGYVLSIARQDPTPYQAAAQGALELLGAAGGSAPTAALSDPSPAPVLARVGRTAPQGEKS